MNLQTRYLSLIVVLSLIVLIGWIFFFESSLFWRGKVNALESTSLELEFKTLNFRLNNVEKQYKELKQELSDYVEPIKQNSNHSKIDNILAKIPKYRPFTRMGTRGEEFLDNWICKL